jgi:hypothetical protein
MDQTKAFRTFIEFYSVFISKRLKASKIFISRKTLVSSIYKELCVLCLLWELGKHLQNKFNRTICKLAMYTQMNDLLVDFRAP